MIAHPTPPSWLQRHWGLLVVLAAILLIAAVRVRLLDCPLERDEGEYAYAGQLMLEGIPPYRLVYNMKFPGTYAAYALIMAAFGQTPAGIHLGVLIVTSLTALLVYWLGRKLLDELTGAAAGAFTVFLSASPYMYGLAGHATHFAALFATAGLCLLWPRDTRGRPWNLIGGGLMFGLAVLMKQHAAFLVLWGLALLTFGTAAGIKPAARGKFRMLAVYSVGVLLPFLVTCLLLGWAGVFEQFWLWTISYAREYVSVVPLRGAPGWFWFGFSQAAGANWLMWVLAVLGFLSLWLGKSKPGFRYEMAGLFLASFLTTCPGFYFRYHYFLLMVPALALLAACALHATRRLPKLKVSTANVLMLLTCVIVLSWTGFSNRDYWWKFTPTEASRNLYGPNPFIEAGRVADFIRTNSLPSARIAVLGSEPQIFFLAQRRSATSYIYMYPLMEPQPFARQMQSEMVSQIEAARPEFVVLATANFSWLQQPGSDNTVIRWWPRSYRDNYVLVGVADIVTLTETRYIWGHDALAYNPIGDSLLLTYQRKDTLP